MSISEDVKNYVNSKIARINLGDPRSAAMLAILRRGAGKTLTESPETWEAVLSDIPEHMLGRSSREGYRISSSEDAIFTALTLYAVHQQGNTKSMNQAGVSVGDGTKKLMLAMKENEEGVKRRFKAVITSAEPSELNHHLRGLVQMMRSSEVCLDYGQLAKDLYIFSNPEWRADVRIRWGEDFYKHNDETDSEKDENKEL
ncbi:MAG: type I-E CRISPR-associated protein Cse2/CasB [Candidatus Methanomethylophilaceae archaeon]|nr:type I-E CRISPR-associated protein Cse2/CasB [Candidatus Methanomethylophilaceae archaeon]